MRLHPVLTLLALFALGSAARLVGAKFFASPPPGGVETTGAIQELTEQDTSAEVLAPPQSARRSTDQEFAAKLLAARQENAERQFRGQPSVWLFLPAGEAIARAESSEPVVTRTRAPSAP